MAQKSLPASGPTTPFTQEEAIAMAKALLSQVRADEVADHIDHMRALRSSELEIKRSGSFRKQERASSEARALREQVLTFLLKKMPAEAQRPA